MRDTATPDDEFREATNGPREHAGGDDRRDSNPGDAVHTGDAAPDAERESAYHLLQRGHALLKQRHNAQAAVILERAARLEPGKASIVEALARAYYNSGRHDLAIGAFMQLLEIDPSAPYGHYGLGQALKQVGRRFEARTHLRLAVALAPDSILYRNALARLR